MIDDVFLFLCVCMAGGGVQLWPRRWMYLSATDCKVAAESSLRLSGWLGSTLHHR